MMDRVLKDKWVTALRSGQYVQGVGELKTKDGKYCCLGVLCEVAGWPIRPGATTLVSREVNAAGFDDKMRVYLAELNDGVPDRINYGEFNNAKPFSYIADYIEKNL